MYTPKIKEERKAFGQIRKNVEDKLSTLLLLIKVGEPTNIDVGKSNHMDKFYQLHHS